MTNTISRRTLAKGAAWSVPVVAVAAAAPTASASPADCITSGTLQNSASIPTTANYTCVQTDEAGNPTGTALGAWKVQIQVATCTAVHAGSTLKAPPTITANVVTSTLAGNVLRGFADGVKIDGGSSTAGYTVSGQVVNAGSRTGNLTVPATTVPASGGISTTATGSGSVETSTTAGSINIAATNFSVVLNWSGTDFDSGEPTSGTSYIACSTGTSSAPATSVPLTPAITVQ